MTEAVAPRADVLGVHVSAIKIGDAMSVIEGWIAERNQKYVCVTGAHGVISSRTDAELRSIHNQSVAAGVSDRFTSRLCAEHSQRQAPRWMQKSGLEWLYRLGTELNSLQPRYTSIFPRFIALGALQLPREANGPIGANSFTG